MEIIRKARIESSWVALKAAADRGVLDDYLKEGDIIPFVLKDGEKVAVVVTHDVTGKMFFVFQDCLKDKHVMNNQNTTKGGWAACDMRKYLNKTVFALLPDDLQAIIAPTKIVQIVDGERVETEDKLFLFSRTQVFGKARLSECEPEDTQFDCFKRKKNREKECGDNGTWFWWLRSANPNNTFSYVNGSGSTNDGYANASGGVALGFCLN